MKRTDSKILSKIYRYSEQICKYLDYYERDFQIFIDINLKFQRHSIFYLVQIGDLANQLSAECIEATPQIPWRAIAGLRNIVARGYERIDYEDIWKTITTDIPVLKTNLRGMIRVVYAKGSPENESEAPQ